MRIRITSVRIRIRHLSLVRPSSPLIKCTPGSIIKKGNIEPRTVPEVDRYEGVCVKVVCNIRRGITCPPRSASSSTSPTRWVFMLRAYWITRLLYVTVCRSLGIDERWVFFLKYLLYMLVNFWCYLHSQQCHWHCFFLVNVIGVIIISILGGLLKLFGKKFL